MDWVQLILAAVGGGGIGAFILKLLELRHRNTTQDRADAYVRQGGLIDRLEKQLSTQQTEIGRLLVGEGSCREELAGMRSDCRWLYGLAQQLHASLLRANIPVDPMPELPERLLVATAARRENDFVRRQSEHAAKLLHDEADHVRQEEGGSE